MNSNVAFANKISRSFCKTKTNAEYVSTTVAVIRSLRFQLKIMEKNGTNSSLKKRGLSQNGFEPQQQHHKCRNIQILAAWGTLYSTYGICSHNPPVFQQKPKVVSKIFYIKNP
jgi:hypothetical protein